MRSTDPVYVIIGGGGHARVVLDTLQNAGIGKAFGVLDSAPHMWGKDVLGIKIIGGDELLDDLRARGVNSFAMGVGGVGDNAPRARLYERARDAGLTPLRVVHPRAAISTHARLAEGVQVMVGSIVNACATLDEDVIVNSGAIVEHDCVIGAHTHIATGARLASTVHIGESAHVGAGATIRQNIRIGAGAIVGAGAVVVRDVPPGALVVGVPAREVKR